MFSVIIITKDEEDVIADCIKSVEGIASEILVIDSHSKDKTTEISEKLGAKVILHDFIDFSNQRNFALSMVKNEWILYLDADERLTSELKEEIKETVEKFKENDGVGGYFIKRKNFFYGKDWNYYDKVQKLFFKKFLKGWKGNVHETPEIIGHFSELENFLLHFTHRNLSQMIDKTNKWSEYEATLRFKSNHPKMNILRFIRVILTGFIRSYFYEKGYRNGVYGFVEATYQAFSMFITYAKLWEKQKNESI